MDTAELILWGIPALCFLFIIWLVVSKINEYKNDSAFSRACDDYIQKNNITCTRDLSF